MGLFIYKFPYWSCIGLDNYFMEFLTLNGELKNQKYIDIRHFFKYLKVLSTHSLPILTYYEIYLKLNYN